MLLTLKQASEFTGYSIDTLRGKIRDGSISTVIIKNKHMIEENDLSTFVKKKSKNRAYQQHYAEGEVTQHVPLFTNEKQNNTQMDTAPITNVSQPTNRARAFKAADGTDIIRIENRAIAKFRESVDETTKILRDLRAKKGLSREMTLEEAIKAFVAFKVLTTMGGVLGIDCSEMFSEVRDIVLSNFPELEVYITENDTEGIAETSLDRTA